MSDKLHVQCILIQKANGLLWVSGYQPPEIFFRRPGEGRGLPFLLREERGAKKRKRDRLGPFSNPHEVPMQEAVRNHRACKSPCGEFVRGGSVSSLQANLLHGHQFTRHRLRPPLSFAHSGVSRSKLRGSRGCNPLRIFGYFLFGRK